jgi:uncharacterized protein
MNPLYHRSYFFDEGIRFGCRRCGGCCTGAPGIVRIDADEITHVADFLGMSVPRVVKKYLTPGQNGYCVRESREGRCLFFEEGCRVYPVRPMQCKTFPFWFTNLRSEARWESIRRQCPGIGRGRRYSKSEILNVLSRDT